MLGPAAFLLWGGLAFAAPRPTFKVTAGGNAFVKDVNGNYDISSTFGSIKGANQFETFNDFSLDNGEKATFHNGSGVSNIFARVTDSRTFLDGTISSPVNFYLINANGITFGQHAQIDVSGSFTATTADVLKFKDGYQFRADGTDNSGPNSSMTLGSAPLSAYGFLGKTTGTIEATADDSKMIDPRGSAFAYTTAAPVTRLTAHPGQSLSFIAGSVDFEGDSDSNFPLLIQAPQGRINIAGVSKGDLSATFGGAPKLGSVKFDFATTTGTDGVLSGGLTLRASNFEMIESQVKTTGTLDPQGHVLTTGAIDAHITGTATFDAGATLMTQTSGAQSAGNFSIRGGNIVVQGGSELGSVALGNSTATAKSGKVSIRAGNLSVRNGSSIISSTQGTTNADNSVSISAGSGNTVAVSAKNLLISGDAAGQSLFPTGIFSNSLQGATGNSGDVNIQATNFRLQGGGLISGDTFTTGKGGNVNVNAGRIDIVGGNAQVKTGIFSDSDSVGLAGNGGNVHVTADVLNISDAGLISTKTLGSGHGGNTVVNTRILTIDRGNTPAFTGIAADSATNDSPTLPAHFAGPGGSVMVTADTAYLLAGGQISASTATQGKGGDVTVVARNLVLQGHVGDAFSNISADSRAQAGSGGNSGNVNVIADQLQVLDGARISATTFGLGSAGSVRVQANTALLSSAPNAPFTGILAVSASPDLAGQGGSVVANFGLLDIFGGAAIAGNTLGPGSGGAVFVQAHTTQLISGGRISADTSGLGAGGSVDLTSKKLLISTNGASRASGIFSSSSGTGKGGPAGSVEVDSASAKLTDGGMISAASSSSGLGGSVLVNADLLTLSSASVIQASATGAGNAGSVTLNVTKPLEIRDSSAIRVTSAVSQAGTATINSASDVDLLRNSTITVQALTDDAGSIVISAVHRLFLSHSSLIAEAGIDGGNIVVDPEYIILDHGRISANATNVGGNILLTADNFLPSETPVTATGSTAGTVEVTAPPLDLSGALAALNSQLIDASIRFQERCAMRLGGEVSSFLVLGRAGTEDGPVDPPVVISLPVFPTTVSPQTPPRKK